MDQMPSVQKLTVEALTEEAFEPFGEVLAVKRREPDLAIAGLQGWIADFQTDAAAQLLFFTTGYGGLRFGTMERHFHITQTVIPVVGAQLVAVAAPTDPEDVDAIPNADEVRAFVAEEGAGYVMKAGTWHAVGRFPLRPPRADFIMVTDDATSTELIEKPQPEWGRTQWVDYKERFGTVFEFDTSGLSV